MSVPEPVEMDTDERDDFLGEGGTGVISFSTAPDEPPHSIPISYGYDSQETTFYFRLAVESDSAKVDLLDRPVTLVVHGSEQGTWRSVVASGHLTETTDESVGTEALQGFERVQIPLRDVFGKPPGQVTFKFYLLDPDSLTGLRESRTGV